MSKLKAYDVIMTPSDDGNWVLKSEADKVIASQKYKRCLAMENMCAYAYDKYLQVECNATKMGKDGVDLYLRSRRKAFHFRRWQYFWMKTAEKFKEAK